MNTKKVKYYRIIIMTLVHFNKQLLLEMFMLLISYLDPAVPQTQHYIVSVLN